MLHNMQSSKANAATRRAKKLRYVQRLFDSPKFTFTPQSASFPFVGTFCDRQHCHLGPNRAAVPGSVKSIFDIGLLNMSFAGKSFGKWKNIFRQSCSQNICLGSILPSWRHLSCNTNQAKPFCSTKW
uniref:Uncharacterized protein n=1 Tax=Trichuris muris TaxID=70415 RepID=A0A5S6QJW7_TRIMR